MLKRKRSLPLKKGGKGEGPNECVVRGRERIEEGANLLKVFFAPGRKRKARHCGFVSHLSKVLAASLRRGFRLHGGRRKELERNTASYFDATPPPALCCLHYERGGEGEEGESFWHYSALA